MADLMPGGLVGLGARTSARLSLANRMRPVFNTTVTNMPGPRHALYMAGAELVAMYGAGMITEGMGLIHPVMSYRGDITISFTSCREMLPDPAFYADCLRTSFDDLPRRPAAAAGERRRVRGGPALKNAPPSSEVVRSVRRARARTSLSTAVAAATSSAGRSCRSGCRLPQAVREGVVEQTLPQGRGEMAVVEQSAVGELVDEVGASGKWARSATAAGRPALSTVPSSMAAMRNVTQFGSVRPVPRRRRSRNAFSVFSVSPMSCGPNGVVMVASLETVRPANDSGSLVPQQPVDCELMTTLERVAGSADLVVEPGEPRAQALLRGVRRPGRPGLPLPIAGRARRARAGEPGRLGRKAGIDRSDVVATLNEVVGDGLAPARARPVGPPPQRRVHHQEGAGDAATRPGGARWRPGAVGRTADGTERAQLVRLLRKLS